jgi:hypothetical protein
LKNPDRNFDPGFFAKDYCHSERQEEFRPFNRKAARDVLLQANGVFALSLQRFNTSTDLKMTREHRQFA